ncbi:hypothetical protein [Diaphorobacter sp. HDW4A]|nr:hypothetical protein [Diaphorobacter sp. HDW4A]
MAIDSVPEKIAGRQSGKRKAFSSRNRLAVSAPAAPMAMDER